MQEKISISVITVCYNAAKELRHTLQSVASQTYPHIQYIVVDGASTDSSLELIKEYQTDIDLLISEPDSGIYDAMNKGIKVATGDYLCFMNAGDTFHSPTTLADLFAQIHRPLPDVIYGETNIVDERRHFLRPRRLKTPQQLTYQSFLSGMVVCHQSFYPRRALVPYYNLTYRFSSDFDWCLNILAKATQTYNSQMVLTDYLAEGTTTRNHRASLKERFRIMTHHYGWLKTLLAHFYFALRALVK
ncbi:PGL/p-HBAD biosynthesis glycosyltransferase Rv2957/MT3031 [Chlamydia trachomatis]|nr:PGL/p-HBAD biosynthesis glycosyltransferase Rv2957/MT3031 [Chlamydia trachomatis]